MSRHWRQHARLVAIITAWLLCGAWLFVVCLWPDSWQSKYGIDEVIYCILISLALQILGLGCLVLARINELRWPFALTITVAPALHLLGAPLEVPLCLPPFMGPSAAIILMGVHELFEPLPK